MRIKTEKIKSWPILPRCLDHEIETHWEEIKEKQVDTRVVIIVSHQKKIINNVKRDWIVTGSSSRPIQIESYKSE